MSAWSRVPRRAQHASLSLPLTAWALIWFILLGISLAYLPPLTIFWMPHAASDYWAALFLHYISSPLLPPYYWWFHCLRFSEQPHQYHCFIRLPASRRRLPYCQLSSPALLKRLISSVLEMAYAPAPLIPVPASLASLCLAKVYYAVWLKLPISRSTQAALEAVTTCFSCV